LNRVNTNLQYILIIVILLLSAIGCDKAKDTSDFTKIGVDLKDSEPYSPSKWFQNIEIILLETNKESVLHNCDKVILHNGRFYILDRQSTCLKVFDMNGKFLYNTAGHQGSGPKEYKGIIDFEINRFTGNIEILEPFSRISFYSRDFIFIRFINLPGEILPLKTFRILKKDLYLFYAGPGSYDGKTFILYSLLKGEIQSNSFDSGLVIRDADVVSVNSQAFYFYNNEYYFTYSYTANDVFRMDTGLMELVKKYELDFGRYNFNPEDLKGHPGTGFMTDNSDKYCFVVDKNENDNYIFAFFYHNEMMYSMKYNKHSGDVSVTHSQFGKPYLLLPPVLTDNESMYYISDAHQTSFFIDTLLLNRRDKGILYKIKEDDNPVIIRYLFSDHISGTGH